ncbi:RES family NAD+ phosphorylase [Massilia sp. Dwa41.01b]|uniref:RES family NAD+ phosphorylase n=1 Tax=unclassified Massilia TaxID=2609279 RepID=UPI001603D467|nr:MULTISPECIES: RES family NAD+ phosphorylase [unclassified Massilia]QNA88061.1 RES family NAD+ phosphorylase [Massilia sp. Dwa41.01b]QNA98967.1 RES family NAD+ phosphorylase [Massilia sp. Se16.2.3]
MVKRPAARPDARKPGLGTPDKLSEQGAATKTVHSYGKALQRSHDGLSGVPEPGPDGKAVIPGVAIAPPPTLHLSTTRWPAGSILHRVHADAYGAVEFNPGLKGNARFSPVKDAAGRPIPTLYGGASFACAAMESVFHDVPFAPGFKFYDKGKLAGQVHSQFDASEDLLLADLGSRALRKLGALRSQLIDTEKDQYPTTRLWAEAIHAAHPQVQGLCWISRQDDSARAVVLFGDRVGEGLLRQSAPSRSLANDPQAYGELLALAEQIGVDIVPGRS